MRPIFLAKRFVAGETLAPALDAVRTLNADGLMATLDFLGEDITQRSEAQYTCETYLQMLDAIAHSGLQANISLKLTALGISIDESLCISQLETIASYALRNADPFVRIDMEGSAFTQKTLEVFQHVHGAHPNIGPVIQACLKRSPGDIERLIEMTARVRLCKGAYRESASIAHRDMSTIRRAYLLMAQALLRRGHYPGLATHDEALISGVRSYAAQHGIPPDRFEFQMLYGVRPSSQRALAAAGYRVRIYVPFGTHWARYLYRRITERKENAFFAFRAFFRK